MMSSIFLIVIVDWRTMFLQNPSWPSGNSAERRTMERAKNLEWQTYSGESYYNILGTPKGENSIKIEQKRRLKLKKKKLRWLKK